MIELLDRVFTSIKGRGKAAGLARFLVRLISNQLIPIYFSVFSGKRSYLKRRKNRRKTKQVVVSLTSFPARINNLWIVFECMFRQSLTPDVIVLYLAEKQFPEKMNSLPRKLRKYSELGLIRISFVKDDFRSHKKYYYSFQEYRESLVVLIDDDLIYTKDLIKGLVELNKTYPDAICCHRAHVVGKAGEGKLLKYREWRVLKGSCKPSRAVFHTSGGGTLYRPSLFNKELFNSEKFMELCFTADDVWLNIQAYISGIKIVKSSYFTNYVPIQVAGDVKLSNLNVGEGQNDKQIKKTLESYGIDEEHIFCD